VKVPIYGVKLIICTKKECACTEVPLNLVLENFHFVLSNGHTATLKGLNFFSGNGKNKGCC
jgi:hypothetical protein